MNTLQRSLGTRQAVVIGLASMVGAGVFFVWSPAAQVAGGGLLIGLAIAAVIATLNALSSAQLAMVHPVSGGTYAYARAEISPLAGFTAGWLFLAGKTASAGAIALIAGSYLWPDQARAVSVTVIVVLAVVNMTGIRSTAAISAGIVTVVLSGIVAVVIAALVSPPADAPGLGALTPGSPYGILQSAGLLFFAFAGYARMATLGEEVRNPKRTLPRAIITALAITLLVYGTIGVLCVALLGTDALAATATPVADLVGNAPPWDTIIRVVAGIACLGSLAGILAGLSRTSLAMARDRELPGGLAWISPRTHAPALAEAVIACLAIAGVVFLQPERLVGFSSCAVLCYYALAHASALRQRASDRWLPRVVQFAGLVGCLVLAFTLPWQALVVTAGVLALGLTLRMLTGVLTKRRIRT